MALTSQGLTLSFDDSWQNTISNLQNSGPLLEENLRFAMVGAVSFLYDSMKYNMDTGFKNPTGALEDSIVQSISPWLSTISVDSPYGWRREEGFSGLTDSLGRYYPNDPGIQYAANAMSKNKSAISSLFRDALYNTALGMSM